MSLIRWDPFSDMDRAIERMFRKSLHGFPRFSAEGNGGAKLEWTPSADISETEQEYLIRAELPAVRKEDVKVTVEAGTITIEGERKQRTEDKSEKFHRVESLYGNFTRTFSLPEDISVEGIRCDNKDGVLTVHLPKTRTEQPKAKQIKVE